MKMFKTELDDNDSHKLQMQVGSTHGSRMQCFQPLQGETYRSKLTSDSSEKGRDLK